MNVLLSCNNLSIKPSPLVLDFFLTLIQCIFSHKCIVLLSLSQVDLRTISALQMIKDNVLEILALLFAHEKALKFIALE